jgi:hypothetical protein
VAGTPINASHQPRRFPSLSMATAPRARTSTTPKECKAVGVAHERGLSADYVADGGHGAGGVRCAMPDEILPLIRQPPLRRGSQQWTHAAAVRCRCHAHTGALLNISVDDDRVTIFAFGDEGLHRGCADRTPEIAKHVEGARRITSLCRGDADRGNRRERGVITIAWPSARVKSGTSNCRAA